MCVYKTQNKHEEIRALIVNELIQNKLSEKYYEKYEPYIAGEGQGKGFKSYDEFVCNTSTNHEWGGNITLQAYANCTNTTIHIVSSQDIHTRVVYPTNRQLDNTLYLLHKGEHYFALIEEDS
jgi:hypothetical protein